MGYLRQGQPAALDRAGLADFFSQNVIVARLIAEEAAFANRTADPFLIDHDCRNPAGHDFIASCGAVVCPHCGRLA